MEKFLERGGTNQWKREAREDRGRDIIEEWAKAYREKPQKGRKDKIDKSRSAKEYKRWITEERSKYLDEKGKGKKLKAIARLRCCNEWEKDRY